MPMLQWMVPIAGIIAIGAIPLVRYAQKTAAEAAAVDALQELHEAQRRFRTMSGGFAIDLTTLITPCPGQTTPALSRDLMSQLPRIGYRLALRAAERAITVGRDCHGRETVSDYYAAVQPEAPASAGQQAFATTSRGRIYLFYDGLPPSEQEMRPGGLAIPHDRADTFKIP
jgi:type II secretory pathway pseudopilin PulG